LQSERRSDGRAGKSATAVATRYLSDGACVAAMLAGMILGGWLGPPVTAAIGIGTSSGRLVSAMAVGMVAGMAVAMPLYRSRRCRDAAHRPSAVR
jgi:hypothetical protein